MIIDRIWCFADPAQKSASRCRYSSERSGDGDGVVALDKRVEFKDIANHSQNEVRMSPSTRHDHTHLLAGVIAPISLYLDTGCPRA